MNPFKIGHFTNLDKGTGCTVILCPERTRASAYARGAAPGTREYALLSPHRKMEEIHALLLTGGSAFGLDAAAGVMRYLMERDIGYHTPFRTIPIVPAAVIYDLYMIDSNAVPSSNDSYLACKNAKISNTQQGNVGAGTGATVGKWAGLEFMMKGGLGISKIKYKDLWIEALVVVNPVGDVIRTDGSILAGAQKEGQFLAAEDPAIRWQPPDVDFGTNTILAVLMTNANLSKLYLYHLAERSHNGIVRAVNPARTSFDGDIIFALGSGELEVKLDQITEMAVECVREAILNGVQTAEPLGGVPSITSK